MMTTRTICLGTAMLCLSTAALAGEAEQAFSSELYQCAAYYDIGSQMVAAMNAPQMASVGDRLKGSAQQATDLAGKYDTQEAVTQGIEQAKEKMMAATAGQGMGGLMKQYKDSCQQILANPEQRLNYWIMAKM